MAEEKKGKKFEGQEKDIAKDKLGVAKEHSDSDVEGQGYWRLFYCPHCGAACECYDTERYDYWRCWHCGGVFS